MALTQKTIEWLKIIWILVAVTTFFSVIIYNLIIRPDDLEMTRQYLMVYEAQFEGRVKNHGGSGGFSFIEISGDSLTYQLQTSAELGGDETSFRFSVVRGDSIFKASKSDTLMVFKKDRTLRFTIARQLPLSWRPRDDSLSEQ